MRVPNYPTPENLTQSCAPTKRASSTTVPAGHGRAFVVKKGTTFRIIDTHGRQIVDLTAWELIGHGTILNKAHHFSSDVTRWKLTGATPAIGEHLYANSGSKLLKITDDTVKVHDMVSNLIHVQLSGEGLTVSRRRSHVATPNYTKPKARKDIGVVLEILQRR
jgi:uncharacterized protein YcgI (DUF1989 family)